MARNVERMRDLAAEIPYRADHPVRTETELNKESQCRTCYYLGLPCSQLFDKDNFDAIDLPIPHRVMKRCTVYKDINKEPPHE